MSDADSVSPELPSQEIAPISGVSVPNPPLVEAVGKSQPAVGSVGKKVSAKKVRRLKPTQEAVVNHYLTPGSPVFGNGRQSYRKVHPNVTPESADVLASKMFGSIKVQEAIKEKTAMLGFGKDEAIEGLVWNIKTSKTQGKLADHREGTKVYLQATGNWKEVQEITHLEDAQKDAIRREVSKALGSN